MRSESSHIMAQLRATVNSSAAMLARRPANCSDSDPVYSRAEDRLLGIRMEMSRAMFLAKSPVYCCSEKMSDRRATSRPKRAPIDKHCFYSVP